MIQIPALLHLLCPMHSKTIGKGSGEGMLLALIRTQTVVEHEVPTIGYLSANFRRCSVTRRWSPMIGCKLYVTSGVLVPASR